MMTEDIYDKDGRVRHEAIRVMLIEVVDDAVSAKFEAVKIDLHEIKTALTGNGYGANRGLITRMVKVEDAIGALKTEIHASIEDAKEQVRAVALEQESRWARLKWAAVGVGIGAGLGGGGIVFAAAKLFGSVS